MTMHGRTAIRQRDVDRPLRDAEQRRSRRVLLEHDLVLAEGAHLRVEHELAHLQRRQLVEDGDIGADIFEPVVDRFLDRQILELRLEDRLVGGFQPGVAVDELDDVIALVHAMLDQRIAGERADHKMPGTGRLELSATASERLRGRRL
jgi:hypothetical protein